MPIIELKIFQHTCDECKQDWTMINPGDNTAYFCPYCGKQQPVQNLFGEYKQANPKHYKPDSGTKPLTERRKEDKRRPGAIPWDEPYERREDGKWRGDPVGPPSEEAIEPSVDEVLHPTIVQKKTPERIEAEDRMTHKVCEEGWWNPITKECQGEGNGHNVVDSE